MPPKYRKIPSYRLHKPTGQAVVRIDGRDYYLGKHETAPSREKYDRLIAEWLTTRHRPRPEPTRPVDTGLVTVNELILGYWEYAQTYYRDEAGPTRELGNIRDALRPVRRLYGTTPVAAFDPPALDAVRDEMVRSGLCRTTVNARVNKTRRMFRWGVTKKLVPADIAQALQALEGLKKGRSAAPEPHGVEPVPVAHVEATLPYLPRQVVAMIRLQLLTGCRPEEVQVMRGCDLTFGESTWEYRPHRHKKKWRGYRRIIPLGPKAQAILREFVKADPYAYLFSPRDVVAEQRAQRAGQRKSKRTPSELAKARKKEPQVAAGERFARVSYWQAVRRACEKAGVPRWTPLQLRHTAATLIRAAYGLEAAQVVLGHENADTTQIYAERDLVKAHEIMVAIG